jgi:hypothetical protein
MGNIESASSFEIVEGFNASTDMYDFKTANKIFKFLKEAESKRQSINDMELYLNLLFKKDSSQNSSHSNQNKIDKEFEEYIYNKRVAIVGPAPSIEKLGDEINSFDIVIRLNYRGKQYLSSIEEFGSKTSLSYYNGANAKEIEKNE